MSRSPRTPAEGEGEGEGEDEGEAGAEGGIMAGGTIATEEEGVDDVMTGMGGEEGGEDVLVPLLVVAVVTRAIAARPVVRLRLTGTVRRLWLVLGLVARHGMGGGGVVVPARVVGEEGEEGVDEALALVEGALLPRLGGTRLVE